MCVININIQSKDDLFFAISNTILSLEKTTFTIEDVLEELEKNKISDSNKDVKKISEDNLKEMVIISIDNLIEHGKVFEEPRVYKLANNDSWSI